MYDRGVVGGCVGASGAWVAARLARQVAGCGGLRGDSECVVVRAAWPLVGGPAGGRASAWSDGWVWLEELGLGGLGTASLTRRAGCGLDTRRPASLPAHPQTHPHTHLLLACHLPAHSPTHQPPTDPPTRPAIHPRCLRLILSCPAQLQQLRAKAKGQRRTGKA